MASAGYSPGAGLPAKSEVAGARVTILHTAWHGELVDELCAGAQRVLDEYPLTVVLHQVPGAYELPQAAKIVCGAQPAPDAIIALGLVLRGTTPHFDYVAGAVSDGLMQVSLQAAIPVAFGVLTVDNLQQARERLGGSEGHKGEEAAEAALQMLALARRY